MAPEQVTLPHPHPHPHHRHRLTARQQRDWISYATHSKRRTRRDVEQAFMTGIRTVSRPRPSRLRVFTPQFCARPARSCPSEEQLDNIRQIYPPERGALGVVALGIELTKPPPNHLNRPSPWGSMSDRMRTPLLVILIRSDAPQGTAGAVRQVG